MITGAPTPALVATSFAISAACSCSCDGHLLRSIAPTVMRPRRSCMDRPLRDRRRRTPASSARGRGAPLHAVDRSAAPRASARARDHRRSCVRVLATCGSSSRSAAARALDEQALACAAGARDAWRCTTSRPAGRERNCSSLSPRMAANSAFRLPAESDRVGKASSPRCLAPLCHETSVLELAHCSQPGGYRHQRARGARSGYRWRRRCDGRRWRRWRRFAVARQRP